MVGCRAEVVPFFTPIKPKVVRLPSGPVVYLLEDRSLPTFEMEIFVRGGSVHDPAGREGLAGLAMQALRTGGSQEKKPEEIDLSLESVGASLEMGVSPEFVSIRLSALKKDIDLGLTILTDLLRNPAFDAGRFEIVRKRAVESLKRDREDPMTVAARELPPLVYGPDSPWGRRPTIRSLESISRDEAVDFYHQMIAPDRFVIAASGDFSRKELLQRLDKGLERWGPAPPLPEIPPLEKKFRPGVWIVPQKGLTQTTLALGHLGERRDSPQKFTLIVMNEVLGGSGSMTSRLGEEIRSKAGKAYGIWSQFEFGRDLGLFKMFAQTASENTGWVARRMIEIVGAMQKDPSVTRDELRLAQRGILRSLVFDFETRFQITKAAARYHLWGYPEDYLQLFQRRLAGLTVRDIEGAAEKYLVPEGLTILAVGEEEVLRRDLKLLGEIRVLELK